MTPGGRHAGPDRRLWTVGAILGLGVAAFCVLEMVPSAQDPSRDYASGGSRADAASRLMDYGPLPDFNLTDAEARPFTRADLRGKVWIADLMFTRCSGQCPMMHSRMEGIAERVPHPDLALVSFSVDPAFDTPEVLAGYARRWKARPGQWRFVTGDAGAVARLARDGFRLSADDGGPEALPATHSVRLVLIDKAAHVRGYYDAEDAGALKRLEADAAALLTTAP